MKLPQLNGRALRRRPDIGLSVAAGDLNALPHIGPGSKQNIRAETELCPAGFLDVRKRASIAFTLIEVMIAVMLFFMAMFTILGVLAGGLHAASLLRTSGPTAGMVAAQLSLTNKLEVGTDSGDFGEIYQGWHWQSETMEATTNGLFQVNFQVLDPSGKLQSVLSVLFYRPDSISHTGLQ